MKLLITFILLVLAILFAGAQDSAEWATPPLAAWHNVLPAGTLKPQPEIVAVEGGFAMKADSFAPQGLRFDPTWLLYDPVTRAWSDHQFPQAAPSLLDLDEELLTLLDIADLVPDDPRIKYQLVDGGRKLAFLLPDEYDFDDLNLYTTVLLVDPPDKTVKRVRVWYCQGPPEGKLKVWDFPEQRLSVICNSVFQHTGDNTRTERTSFFIGSRDQGPLYLYSHSPDHRYWILGWDEVLFDGSGPFYIYDNQTEQTTIMLWQLPHKPRNNAIVWLSNSSLLTNVGEYILHLDMANRQRHELLRDELAMHPGANAFMKPELSLDGEWLLVAAGDGSLHIRNVFAALAEVAHTDAVWSRDR